MYDVRCGRPKRGLSVFALSIAPQKRYVGSHVLVQMPLLPNKRPKIIFQIKQGYRIIAANYVLEIRMRSRSQFGF